jgi:hypothetical protein
MWRAATLKLMCLNEILLLSDVKSYLCFFLGSYWDFLFSLRKLRISGRIPNFTFTDIRPNIGYRKLKLPDIGQFLTMAKCLFFCQSLRKFIMTCFYSSLQLALVFSDYVKFYLQELCGIERKSTFSGIFNVLFTFWK